MNKRLSQILSVFALCGLFLVFVQLRICIIEGENYSKRAAFQRMDTLNVKNHRGKFYDRNMIPLVETEKTYRTFGTGENARTLATVSRYDDNSALCHVIGYTDGDGIGVSGLEKCFDTYVSVSSYDKVNVIKSANGEIIETAGLGYDKATGEGNSVMLTLDYHIQQLCGDALKTAGVTGAVAVMDVSSFDVLAMASSPVFNQNNVSQYLGSTKGEFINRCQASYNAGSIFKIITLCSALENNKLKNKYNCTGVKKYKGNIFACHKSEGHGELTSSEALAKSCNCAFYEMGIKVGADELMNTALGFGLGNTVVHCTAFEETSGNIPQKTAYASLDAVNYAIGQGEILLTPLQAANMVCIIANDGVAKKSNIAIRVADSCGITQRMLREVGSKRVVSSRTAYFVKKAMELAVTEGTAKLIKDNPAGIAGKTGTAETGWIQDGEELVHGWFCGYFPKDNPRYAMAVLVEGGGSGSESALPLFGKIAEEIIKIYPLG